MTSEQEARRYPVFSPMAEHGLLVEFGDRIAHDVHALVLQLDRALATAPFPGFVESVPAYASILIRFDPILADHASVQADARRLMGMTCPKAAGTSSREVLVCYEDALAPDLAAVAEATGLSKDAVIAAHLAGAYEVFMYGFAPGYAYLAGVPDAIQLPRKAAAVRDVPAGSVLIAGPQCLVSTIRMPTGWSNIGRSPTRILTEEADRPFLFDVGDRVCFRRIDRAEYEAQALK